MSRLSGDWARSTRGHSSPSQRSVLIELAHWYKDKDKTAWRNVDALAESCGVSERTVRRCLAQLEENGYITRLNNGNQYQHTFYRLNMESEPDTVASSKPKVNRTSCQVNRTLTTSEPDINDTTLKERTHSTLKVPISISQNQPEWLTLLIDEIPKTQRVKRKPRWTELFMARTFNETEAMRVARALISHTKPYKNYYLTFLNWIEPRQASPNGANNRKGAAVDTAKNPFGPPDPEYQRQLTKARERQRKLENS